MKYLKSQPHTLATTKVQKDQRIIRDVVLVQAGPAKGHGVNLEQSFVEEAHRYATRHWEKAGLKCRFGHPNMCDDALGTEVGRFRNFRLRDDQLIADLTIYNALDESPKLPGAGKWILSMAEEDPNAFMCSIVFTAAYRYYYDKDGKKKKLDEAFVEEGETPIYVALKDLHATDLVDEGAATASLFSELNADQLAAQVTQFLDEHPKVWQLLQQGSDKIPHFLSLYEAHRNRHQTSPNRLMKLNFMNWFSGTEKVDTPEVTVQVTDLENFRQQLKEDLQSVTQFTAKLEAIENAQAALKKASEDAIVKFQELSDAVEKVGQLAEKIGQVEANIASLSAEVEKIGNKPAAGPANPVADPNAPPVETEKPWESKQLSFNQGASWNDRPTHV